MVKSYGIGYVWGLHSIVVWTVIYHCLVDSVKHLIAVSFTLCVDYYYSEHLCDSLLEHKLTVKWCANVLHDLWYCRSMTPLTVSSFRSFVHLMARVYYSCRCSYLTKGCSCFNKQTRQICIYCIHEIGHIGSTFITNTLMTVTLPLPDDFTVCCLWLVVLALYSLFMLCFPHTAHLRNPCLGGQQVCQHILVILLNFHPPISSVFLQHSPCEYALRLFVVVVIVRASVESIFVN